MTTSKLQDASTNLYKLLPVEANALPHAGHWLLDSYL